MGIKQDTASQIPLHIFGIRLRTLVLALGESSNPAWWKTEFMNETGLRFLERLYPRTPVRAAVHAAGRAACEIHDRAVGRVGVYHLFRLPEALESEATTIKALDRAAAAYRDAFKQGKPTFPYFAAEQNRIGGCC